LRVQPDHYESLFFLALLFQNHMIERRREAIAYYAACIALHPELITSLTNRGNCFEALGELDEAEADYSQACSIAAASNNLTGRLSAFEKRCRFYQRLGKAEKAQEDLNQCAAVLKAIREAPWPEQE